MSRSYYSKPTDDFLREGNDSIYGRIAKNHHLSLEEQQKKAWLNQIDILKDQLKQLSNLKGSQILFEYIIPRMGKRVDNILLYKGIVFVIEFKVGEKKYPRFAIDQVVDYALDLKNFHEQSNGVQLVPILVSTEAPKVNSVYEKDYDDIFRSIKCNSSNISSNIENISQKYSAAFIDPIAWEESEYYPTPTIIEAIQALYRGHSVKEISRSDSGAYNLSKTTDCINEIIEKSKKEGTKAICFITGVPGSGKTLAGLNLACERHKYDEEEHAVFLSGNGPLVKVLQEALARDDVERSKTYYKKKISKNDALRKARAFIQNIHQFRDNAYRDKKPPFEKVVIFDEAQRAWNKKMASDFMKRKRGDSSFDMSEPDFLISVMDRHKEWTVIICLVGGGQEIHRGESGLPEWFSALKEKYTHWKVYLSTKIVDFEYLRGNNMDELLKGLYSESKEEMHLSTSIRSFRSEKVSDFVKSLLDCDEDNAKGILETICSNYPIVLTRDIEKAKGWLKEKSRGSERIGMTASSGAGRLKPYGIYEIDNSQIIHWFLNSKEDVRSSFYLEGAASEFLIQGLELDWTCVAWDADLRFQNNDWAYLRFVGTNWVRIRNSERQIFLKNAYRVLLTRARQGIVIFIPNGDVKDHTRLPVFYDKTYEYLKEMIGIKELA